MSDQNKSIQAEDEFLFDADLMEIGENLADAGQSTSAGDSAAIDVGMSDDAASKSKSRSNGLLIGGGILVLLVLLGGVGYIAMGVLGGGRPAPGPSPSDFAQSTTQPAPSGGPSFGNGDISLDGRGWDSGAAAPGWGDAPSTASGFGDGNQVLNPGSTPVPPAGPSLAEQSTHDQDLADVRTIEINHGADVAEEHIALSDEEMMYDMLLQKANQIDAPAEAIVIDQSVIQRQMNTRRLQELEGQVEATRSSIGAMQDAVGDIAKEIKGLSKVVEESTANHRQLAERVDQLAQTVESIDSQNDLTELKGMISRIADQATNAQRTANRALANQGAGTQASSTVASSSAPAPATAQGRAPAPAPAPAQAPTPTPAPATASAPAVPVRQSQPAASLAATEAQPAATTAQPGPIGCDTATVSNLWSVKGVNSTSAYIVRKSDKAGLFLRAGIEVPGFGRVVSFNPEGRFICTTSGMIRR